LPQAQDLQIFAERRRYFANKSQLFIRESRAHTLILAAASDLVARSHCCTAVNRINARCDVPAVPREAPRQQRGEAVSASLLGWMRIRRCLA
jgi:hypothetical protein